MGVCQPQLWSLVALELSHKNKITSRVVYLHFRWSFLLVKPENNSDGIWLEQRGEFSRVKPPLCNYVGLLYSVIHSMEIAPSVGAASWHRSQNKVKFRPQSRLVIFVISNSVVALLAHGVVAAGSIIHPSCNTPFTYISPSRQGLGVPIYFRW